MDRLYVGADAGFSGRARGGRPGALGRRSPPAGLRATQAQAAPGGPALGQRELPSVPGGIAFDPAHGDLGPALDPHGRSGGGIAVRSTPSWTKRPTRFSTATCGPSGGQRPGGRESAHVTAQRTGSADSGSSSPSRSEGSGKAFGPGRARDSTVRPSTSRSNRTGADSSTSGRPSTSPSRQRGSPIVAPSSSAAKSRRETSDSRSGLAVAVPSARRQAPWPLRRSSASPTASPASPTVNRTSSSLTSPAEATGSVTSPGCSPSTTRARCPWSAGWIQVRPPRVWVGSRNR